MQNSILLILLFLLTAAPECFSNEWLRRGDTKLIERDFDQAFFYFSRSIEEYPNDVKGYLKRAKVLMLQNKYEEARNDYKKALELNADYLKRELVSPARDTLNLTSSERELFITKPE